MAQAQDIGWAVKQMWNEQRVCRAGWNGKGMWLQLVPPGGAHIAAKAGGGYDVLPFVLMKTADNKSVPWLCSMTDLLAIDWELAS